MNPDDETECPCCGTRYTLIYNTADLSLWDHPVYCPFCGEEISEERE